MFRNRLYYQLKPLIPRSARLAMRRQFAVRKRRDSQAVWPIFPGSEKKPEGWPGWPEGKQFAVVLTHDVEDQEGLEKCLALAAVEKELGFRSSFNFIPEGPYRVSKELRDELASQGFEVGVHDLQHDGKLYLNRNDFQRKAERINHYVRDWNVAGFRSGFMLHNLDWLHSLNIRYDASTFDTDPFEPQPEGRHTIFPFWVPAPSSFQRFSVSDFQHFPKSGYVELPYTLPQDSTLFLILRESTPDVWIRKLDWIASHGGMALVNVHPDYVRFENEPESANTFPIAFYRQFLKHLIAQYSGAFWNPLPAQLATWYRQQMLPVSKTTSEVLSNPKAADVTPAQVQPSGRRPLSGKRAAVLLYSYYPSDPRPRRAAEALVEAGMEVDLICLQEKKEEPRREVVNGVRVLRLPLSKRKETKLTYIWRYSAFVLGCAARLAARLPYRRYDLVHAHNMPDFIAFGALPAKLNGARVILDLHDPMPELMTSIYGLAQDHWLVRALRQVERLSIGFANMAITPNLAFKKLFESRGCPPGKMQIVMNTPQPEIFDPDRFASNETSRRETGEFRIMHHGSIVHRHGIDLLVEAIAQLRPRIPRISLDIYGSRSPFIDTVLETAARLGIADCVHYHGPKPQTEIAEAIRRCDLGVVPNRRSTFTETNFPTRLFEYLSMHRPVIAPSTQGIRDYFDASQMLFFEPGNVSDLAARILWVWEHPEETRTIIQNGTTVYRQHLWREEKAHLVNLVAKLCQ